MFLCRCPKCRQCTHAEAVKAGWNPEYKCTNDLSTECDPNIAPQCKSTTGEIGLVVAVICVISFICLIMQL